MRQPTTTTTAAVVLAVLGVVTGAGCDSRACNDEFDCPLAESCSPDGVCVVERSTVVGTGANTAVFVRGATAEGDVVVDAPLAAQEIPATLDGNIANADASGRARGQLTPAGPGIVHLVVTHPTLASTFIAVFRLPLELLGEPGDHALGAPTDLTSPLGQACNYDTTGYDEQVADVVLHVPEPTEDAAVLPIAIEFHSPHTNATATAEVPLR